MKRPTIILLELDSGKIPFEKWVMSLTRATRVYIYDYIERIANGGGKKNIRRLSDDIFEIKITRGPGYRVYFAKINDIFLILLSGDNSSQKRDIKKAKDYWRSYNVQNKRF